MIESNVYRLVDAWEIEETKVERELKDGWVAVEPTYGSICHADLRYFTGSRRPEAMAEKLPMALIHEGIGVVQESKSDQFEKGDRVVIVPNIPGRLLGKEVEGDTDQYSENGVFMGSGYDGIAQSMVVHPAGSLVKIPDEISDEVAVLSEMSSISVSGAHTIEDLLEQDDITVAVFGDGPVGYMTATYIHYNFGVDRDSLTVFGADEYKLSQIDFAHTEDVRDYDFDNPDRTYDIVIDGTGGKFSQDAINQGIEIINNQGTILLMGVSEDLVPINTRDILEKGLTLHGSSRSVTNDYQIYIDLLLENEDYYKTMAKILPDETDKVASGEDFAKIMKHTAENPRWEKVVMEFKWD